MIEGIRRMVSSSGGGDPWDADRELEPEVKVDFEFPVENTIMVSPIRKVHSFSPKTLGEVEFQKKLVQSALEHGGRFDSYAISISWLRMIMAGLEGRPIEPEEAWRDVEAPDPDDFLQNLESSYQKLFPASKDSPDQSPK